VGICSGPEETVRRRPAATARAISRSDFAVAISVMDRGGVITSLVATRRHFESFFGLEHSTASADIRKAPPAVLS
jgi:hypothetical protein